LQTFRQNANRITVPMIMEGNNSIGGGTGTGTVGQIDSPITLKGNVNLQGLASGAVPSPAQNNPIILAGNISESGGSFGLSAIGNNTTTLAGTNSYTGNTTINSGATIQIGGIQGDAATPLAPGTTGTLGTGAVVNNGSLVFNRSNNFTTANDISGSGTVTKLGAGTLILSSNNLTYSGATSVGTATAAGGTLLVNGMHTGGGAYTVNANSTLGGTGSITATSFTFTGANSTLAPGTSAGTLTLNGAVVLNSASKLVMELNGAITTPGGPNNDLVAGVTSLTLAGTLDVLDAVPNSFAAVTNGSTWTLITYSGTLTNSGMVIGATPASLPAGATLSLDLSQTGFVNLVASVAAVPEANAFLAVGLVASGMGFVQLMRRRRSAGSES
jgi:autotransporter-associated beta strand protein